MTVATVAVVVTDVETNVVAIAVAYAATTVLTAAAIEVATSVVVSDSSDSTAASNWRELVLKKSVFCQQHGRTDHQLDL